ncbi:MAG TPA: alpha/beta hydrolase [Solirubrobacteraceae bacterium]|nr:alpha/beta hydrolase [Solirubrobacteraceae bacterium]
MERQIQGAAGILRLDDAGAGAAIVGLHGLSATRRYVVMGSRFLERSGYRVVLYDARGHGGSDPPPTGEYSYRSLAEDLLAMLDALELERAVLVGASMGAHTALRFALDNPARVAALALITPGHDPDHYEDELAHWDALSAGLRDRGIDGFLEAYDLDRVPSAWRETLATVIRQRLSSHEHPLAVAEALAAVPRSRPFDSLSELTTITAPTLVVASRDEADPGHPLALAERYAAAVPGSSLIVEDEGRSPIAWQGGQLSRAVAQLAERFVQ